VEAEMKLKMFLELFRKPYFFLIKGKLIERNFPITLVDVGTDLNYLLKRKGNEEANYVFIGFKVQARKGN
jgi:hypothetical protein